MGKNPNKIADTLAFNSDATRISKLKNGISMNLEFIKIDSRHYYFKYTCAFDSLEQILLVAASDHRHIKERIRKLSQTDQVFNLINDVIQKGITANTYRQRGKIILNYSSKISKKKPVHVDCATAVNTLQEHLFKQCPSFYKVIQCSENCSIIKDHCLTHIIQLNILYPTY